MAFKYAIGFRFWCSSIPGERFKNRKGVGFIMFYPNARFWLTYSTDKTTAPTPYIAYMLRSTRNMNMPTMQVLLSFIFVE